eukprot:SAG31_NODE_13_length_37961_cov_21.751307_27_plen_158_part_00
MIGGFDADVLRKFDFSAARGQLVASVPGCMNACWRNVVCLNICKSNLNSSCLFYFIPPNHSCVIQGGDSIVIIVGRACVDHRHDDLLRWGHMRLRSLLARSDDSCQDVVMAAKNATAVVEADVGIADNNAGDNDDDCGQDYVVCQFSSLGSLQVLNS